MAGFFKSGSHLFRIAFLLLAPWAMVSAEIPPSERDALIDLYQSTGGPDWTNSAGWLGPPGSEGQWHGVMVEDGHVVKIDLSCNGLLGFLPDSMVALTHLQELNLRSCQINICCFPVNNHVEIEAIGVLASLRSLTIDGIGIQKLPPGIKNLKQLEFLSANSNEFADLPDELFALENLKTLFLRYNLIENLPASSFSLSELVQLDLGNNRLSGLPAWIGNFHALQSLDLEQNELDQIPASIGQLSDLRILKLGWNQLTALPESIGNLAALEQLDLQQNKLTQIPPDLGDLLNLTELDLSVNSLTELPFELTRVSSLETLLLEQNELTALPADLGNLSRLVTLSVANNRLEFLPPSIGLPARAFRTPAGEK